ncbi:MAG: diacylglycerol kinase family protein [Bacteroidales bacterium]|nr:diacylglycerol kinase family protein [Bacteroidales bacterium]
MSLPKEIHSFICAFAGIFKLIKSERHAQFHLFATICVIIAGFLFGISKTEWIAVCFAIALVFSAEGFNTTIEKLCDKVSPEYDKKIGDIKDIAAGSVLICSIMAAIIGLIVFVPYLYDTLNLFTDLIN